MANITITRDTKANIEAMPIVDGRIYFETDQTYNKIYTDNGTNRIQIGGQQAVDTSLSTTSTNPIANNVVSTEINKINTDLSAINTGLSNKLSGYAPMVDISNSIAQTAGYTAEVDGTLYALMNPATISDAYIQISSSDGNGIGGNIWIMLRTNDGGVRTCSAPAIKGVTYKRMSVVNSNLKVLFIPFKK